ncbi:MAG: hypothetical protein CMJ75_01865 [Planctomycetaceae bacterium]|nr:hypothetical protein [Planctomycetaceae bacterium]
MRSFEVFNPLSVQGLEFVLYPKLLVLLDCVLGDFRWSITTSNPRPLGMTSTRLLQDHITPY